jgi:hypothetical protein
MVCEFTCSCCGSSTAAAADALCGFLADGAADALAGFSSRNGYEAVQVGLCRKICHLWVPLSRWLAADGVHLRICCCS